MKGVFRLTDILIPRIRRHNNLFCIEKVLVFDTASLWLFNALMTALFVCLLFWHRHTFIKFS